MNHSSDNPPLTPPTPFPSIERMSSTASQVQQREQAPPAHTPGEHPLAQLVRDNTHDGKTIVRFLIDAMQGRIDGAKPSHRIDAARLLLKLGCDDARAFIADFSRHTRPGGGAYGCGAIVDRHNRRYISRLAKFVRCKTGGGRDLVNFLVDAMQGKPEDFKPSSRLAAAKELLRLGWETIPVRSAKNRKTRRSEAAANGLLANGRQASANGAKANGRQASANGAKANGRQASANGAKANGRQASANGRKAPGQRPKQERLQKNPPGDRTDSPSIRQPRRTAAKADANANANDDTARLPADPPGAPQQDGSSQEPRPGPADPPTEPGNRRRGSSPPPVSRPPPLIWV